MARQTEGERAHFKGIYPIHWDWMKYVREQKGEFTAAQMVHATCPSEMSDLRVKAADDFMRKVYPKSIRDDRPGVYIPSIIEDGGTYPEDPPHPHRVFF